DFAAHRTDVAATDLHVRPGRALRLAQRALLLYERAPSRRLRARALERCYRRVLLEHRTTRGLGLSPVNALLGCLVLHARGERDEVDRALAALEGWRFEDAAEGVRYAGARSHTWDTAFAAQA